MLVYISFSYKKTSVAANLKIKEQCTQYEVQ